MLLRHRSAASRLSLPRITAATTLRRPRLPSRYDAAGSPSPVPVSVPVSVSASAISHRRPLATAVNDQLGAGYAQSPPPLPLPLPLYHPRGFDPATTVRFNLHDDVVQKPRGNSQGVPGGIDEMMCVFDACLDVNKLERAALVLERFNQIDGLTYGDLIDLHNRYLRAALDQAIDQPESPLAGSMHRWFESQIRGKDIPITPETVAFMLKFAVLSTRGAKLNKLVKRYMDMLPEEEIWSVLDTGILNSQDFGTIARIYRPTSRAAIEEWDSIVAINQSEDAVSAEMPPPEESADKSKLIPEVLAVPQKGLGLKTLRDVLSFFDQIEGQDLSKLTLDERREVQARLERDCVDAAINRWRDENKALSKIGRNTALSSAALNPQLYDWQTKLETKLKEEFALCDEAETREKKTTEDIERCIYGPFFRQSTPARLAAVTIMGVLNSLAHHGADKGVALATLVTNLARVVEDDINWQARQRRDKEYKVQARKEYIMRRQGLRMPSDRNPSQRDVESAFGVNSPKPTNSDADSQITQLQKEALKTPSDNNASQNNVESSLSVNSAKPINSDVDSQAQQPRKPRKRALKASSGQETPPPTSPTHEASMAADTMAPPPDVAATVTPDATATVTHEAPGILESSKQSIKSWPVVIKAKVGAQLMSALLDVAKIKVVREHPETHMPVSQMQPAFARTTIHRKGKKVGTIMPNKVLVDLMKREPRGDYLARHLPMLVEPLPWSKFDRGGFLEFPAQLMRVKNGERDQKIYTDAAIERGDLDQVGKALDVLGRTAWRINRPVFDVQLEAWNSGEKVANIPPLNPNIPIPEEPDVSDDPLARREWLKRVKLVENEKSGLHSERCFMNFQFDIARAFREQTFYFPHNMDFRGRAYPIPAYLNHMGADHVRGLLQFAVGKELGENGLRWLKVQLANVFGFDKASLDEREAFAMDHLEDISDSVLHPLTGRRWWLKAEDPWQCLAACFELKAALDSPDPTKFVSHLPVQQDGTCNGLQHYAALGGDTWGAQQVNLLPGDRPADVYSAVADLVKAGIADDLALGGFLAKAVDGKITRKVVKQTVMTNVYGVTFMGAKAQVLKQLKAAHPNIEEETGIPTPLLASYIATKIFKGLSTMFRGAHDIQYWLGECAGRVCRALTREQLDRISEEASKPPRKSTVTIAKKKRKPSSKAMEDLLDQFRSTIIWTTPLRMPIVQPYRKSTSRVISTCLQDLNLAIPDRSDPVNRRKQLQAFPPNFIHSLDASHMLLSALECDDLGLSFAAVHDSFWTHAADVNVMNRVLRDAFVRIHTEDVIGRLASEFEARYSGSLYLAKVERSTDAAGEIIAHRGKLRNSMHEELLTERQRQTLLASSDPKEVEEGMKMITPASIYEKYSAAELLPTNDEIDAVALGNITSEVDDVIEGDGNSQEAQEAEEEIQEKAKELLGMSHFEATLKKISPLRSKKTVAKKPGDYVSLWLPLTFPPIPEKGDFDVRQLKDSKYFFS
ncbi:DNA-dependent RNA polymerase [Nemania sp. FL0916]|nr:DNA-dependent RNA polymerase [Nemania sp. FL0916]